MSYQKKSVILQELEQAIRKKALEKSRNKEQVGRNLQSSVEKKKQGLKTALTKEHRIGSTAKNQNHQRSDKVVEKHISLFNNDLLNPTESNEFKLKKHNNRKFDKLVSLIQYMISSSQKAIKYISSTNFQAQFALKLYKSDKQNLLNEVKNFNVQQFIESCRNSQQTTKNDPSYQLILEENNKLKKQLLIMEKEAEQYHKSGEKDLSIKAFERQNHKLKESIRKLIPFENYKQLIEMIEKENKFEAMAVKCQENRKIAEIEIVVTSLAAERNEILEGLAKGKGEKTDRAHKIGQIQGQKEQLQKEINILKSKINQLKESSKLMAEHEILKKNTELLNEKLISLLNQITDGSVPSKRNSQILIEAIKSKVVDLIDRKEELQKQNSRLKARMQELKAEQQELLLFKEQKEEQAMAFERRMESMIGEIQNLKENVDLLNSERDEALEKLNDAERLLRNKEEEIQILKEQLIEYEQKDIEKQQLKAKVNELKKQTLILSKKLEDKEKYYKDKLQKVEEKKLELEEQLDQMAQNLEANQKQVVKLTKANESKSDEAELAFEQMKIEHSYKEELLNARIAQLEQKISHQTVKYDKLMSTYEQSNDYYKALTDSYNEKHQKVNELETCITEMQQRIDLLLEQKEKITIDIKQSQNDQRVTELNEQIGRFQSQCQRVKKENEGLNDKLRTLQQEMIKNCYSSEELETVRDQNRTMRSTIAQLESTIAQIQGSAKQAEQRLRQAQANADRLQAQLQQLIGDHQQSQQDRESLQVKIQQQSERYIAQIKSLSSLLQTAQIKNAGLLRQKAQIQQTLTLEAEKSQAFSRKISLLENQLEELTQQMRSFTKISNGIASEKEQAKEQILSFQQEVKTLRMELQSTKQQIQDQAEINHYKNKQYTYLVKQILKGISIDPQSFEHLQGFQELLEFGSQQVVAMRKRLREEESNRRRNNRKQGYSSNSEADSPRLEELKTQLFTAGQAGQGGQEGQEYNALVESQKDEEQKRQQENVKQEKLDDNVDRKVQITEFQEIRNEETDSVVSEDNRCNLDQFNDLKSQRMNQSMLSQTEEQNLGEAHTNRDQKAESQGQQGNNLSDFKDMDSKVNQSLISVENDENLIETPSPQENKVYNEQLINYRPKIIQDVSQMNSQKQPHSKPLSNNSKDFNVSNISPRQQFHYQSKVNQSSEGSLFSPRGKDAKIALNKDKLDDFEEVRSDNQSFVSSREIKAKASIGSCEINYRSDVMVYPITKVSFSDANQENSQEIKQEQPDENVSGADFEQFNNLQANKMNESMLSEKEHNFSQFNELPQGELNESMLSRKEEGQSLGIDNFGEVSQEQVNTSVLSQKQHGMSQFGDLEEGPNNQSMLSHHEKKSSEHGISQFGEFEEQRVNDSILSQKIQSREDEGLMKEKQEQGNSLDEFDEFKADVMNQSIVSETGSKN